jgi:polysaccharide export outer membrane protein
MFATQIVVVITSLFVGQFLPAQTDRNADALLRYVKQARNAGLDDAQIQKNAESAGWSASVVKKTIAQTAKSGAPTTESAAASRRDSKAESGGTTAVAADAIVSPAGRPVPKTAAGVQPPPKDRGVPAYYEIGAGDVLHISVWKEPDASVQSAVVRPDGNISMPLVKDVQVLGLTPPQAEKLITEELSNYFSAPDVTVVVSAVNSKKIYVSGGVKKEGPIAYSYRMTVLQAINEAGGLTDYAKKKKIYVLHTENGRQFTVPFDYTVVVKGRRPESNVYLTAGDTVVVPQ